MNRRGGSLLTGIIIFIIVLFALMGALIGQLAPLIFMGIVLYFIVKAIQNATDKNKKKNKTTSNRDEEKILSNLEKYFQVYDRLNFDDETYIEPEKNAEISYDTLNIFINGEYISNMSDYKAAFPNSYSTFLNMIGDYVKQGKFVNSKKTNNQTVSEKENLNTTESTAEAEKDAEYYIDKLNELNNEIDNKDITNYLYESVLYLGQIKKIEDTFPKSKDKTTKLYQYYLPMLTEILENYKRLSINANLHAEFKENEDRLLKTLVLINGALKTLSEDLCDEYYIEMSADMKTLEALLKKDGLADSMTFENFKKEKENNENQEASSNG